LEIYRPRYRDAGVVLLYVYKFCMDYIGPWYFDAVSGRHNLEW